MMRNYFKIKGGLIILFNFFFLATHSMYSSTSLDSITLDSGIHYGILPNGLTYYFKPIKKGSSKIDISLFIKAGSALLDQDQNELHHFLEHVVFKAGKNMTIAKANNLGFKLGEINGSTSFDFTGYYFKGIESLEKRDIAFQLIQDIIWNQDFKNELIDSERSIIADELVVRGRFQSNSVINILENSMIGRRPKEPEDVLNHLNTFPHEALTRYYKDWYRPELMAIVVVGDIKDLNGLEQEIIERFSKPKYVENPRSAKIDYSTYRNLPPQYISKKHPYISNESKNNTVYLRFYLRLKQIIKEQGLDVLKNEQKRKLMFDMLENRLKTQQANYKANYVAFPRSLFPTLTDLKLQMIIEDGLDKDIVIQTMQGIRQIFINGFSNEEFEKQKKHHIKELSKIDTMNLAYWTSNIRDYFIFQKALPKNKEKLLMEAVKGLSLEDFNLFIKKYLSTNPDNIDIIVLAPPGHRILSYTEKEVRSWINQAYTLPMDSYIHPKAPTELIDSLTLRNLSESSILRKSNPLHETTEYLLSNGVRIVLNSFNKSLAQKTNQINKLSIHGFTSKGISSYSEDDYFSAINSVEIVRNSGVGGLNKFELERYFNDKNFSGQIIPYIDYDEAGVMGGFSLNDLETALQLIYLYFTHPNKNVLAFEDWKQKAKSSFSLSSINDDDFNTTIRSTLKDYTYLPKGTKALEGVSLTDMNRAHTIYKGIFGNAKGFTFIFTGNFPEEVVLSLCRKYLGNLPSDNTKQRDKKINYFKKYTVPKPREVIIPSPDFMKSVNVQMVFASKLGNKDFYWKEEVKAKILRQMLAFSASQRLRFHSDKGGTYAVSVGMNPEINRLFNEFFVRFSCSPGDVDRLICEVKEVFESYKSGSIDSKLLEDFKQSAIINLESEKSNRKVSSDKIYNFYRLGHKFKKIEEQQEYIKSISLSDIENIAKRLLKSEPFEFRMVGSGN